MESSKRICPESCFFFNHQPVPLYCTYVLCTRGRRNISLIEDLVRLRAQKHKPTMASTASPRAANLKMVESPDSIAHASSSYACAEDGYFKPPHTARIDGNIWWDSCWFLVGFGVGGRLTRDQLGESLVRKNTPPTWRPPLPSGHHGAPPQALLHTIISLCQAVRTTSRSQARVRSLQS